MLHFVGGKDTFDQHHGPLFIDENFGLNKLYIPYLCPRNSSMLLSSYEYYILFRDFEVVLKAFRVTFFIIFKY